MDYLGDTHEWHYSFFGYFFKKLSAALDLVPKLCHLFIYVILFYSIFALKDILLSLAFDELSWDYTPAPAMEPGCLDTFWLEFDTPGYDGQSLEVQRLQVFSKQVSLTLFGLKFWRTLVYFKKKNVTYSAMDLKFTSLLRFF